MTSPDTEQCIASLPQDLQERMARLVLGGWQFLKVGKVYPSWKATDPNNWRKLYAGSTLLTLLNQMADVVQDTEAGIYEAFDMRGISHPEELEELQGMRRRAVVPDAASVDAAIELILNPDFPPR